MSEGEICKELNHVARVIYVLRRATDGTTLSRGGDDSCSDGMCDAALFTNLGNQTKLGEEIRGQWRSLCERQFIQWPLRPMNELTSTGVTR